MTEATESTKQPPKRGLQNRHVQLIAIGGTIGTGLFMGAGHSINFAGPSILFVYLIIGLFMFVMMRAIGELLYADPSQHTFITFITRYIGNRAGFFCALVLLVDDCLHGYGRVNCGSQIYTILAS